MPELQLKTDILAPRHTKTLKFAGYHPSRFLKIAPILIKDIFRITEPNTFEDKIKWDKSGDPIEFYGEWRGKDGKDKRTTFWVKIKADGIQREKDKMGEITIKVSSFIDTKFPYSNFLDKSLVRIYCYLYYNEIRRRYVEEARLLIEKLEIELKKELEAMGG